MARKVNEGHTEGGLPYLSFGEGPLLVVFPGLGMTNANPSGIQRWGEMRLLAPLARTFTIHRISRRVGLAYGTTIEVLASDYAGALEEFGVRSTCSASRRAVPSPSSSPSTDQSC